MQRHLPAPKGYSRRCQDHSGYLTPAGKLPSVTRIIQDTKSDEAKERLANWKERNRKQFEHLPDKQRQLMENGAANRGTWTHTQAENWILQQAKTANSLNACGVDLSGVPPADLSGVPKADLPGVAFQAAAWGGYWKSLKGWLEENFHSALALEKPIWHGAGFSGTFDCLGWTYDSCDLTLFDWKTRGSKPFQPGEEQLHNYEVQLAAYCAGIHWTYGLEVNRAHLVIAYRGTEPQVFLLEKDQLQEREREFFHRLSLFQRTHGHVLA